MRIAILVTNTDESAFAQQHPKDGEKFTALVRMARPDWDVDVFVVKDDDFPSDISIFDGAIITGSPASVHDSDPWVAQLLELIRSMYAQGVPMFGACYGHQAIALALGGAVGPNPAGWVFGCTQSQVIKRTPWMTDVPDRYAEYAAHIEAVTRLPDGAATVSASQSCAVTGYHIGARVFTTQNHPEMTQGFAGALVEEYQSKLPPEVGAAARASLAMPVNQQRHAETIARFFEAASAG